MLAQTRNAWRFLGLLGLFGAFPASAVDNLGDPHGHLATTPFTVFAFSQTDPGQMPVGVADPQVLQLRPDINIRALQKWSSNGLQSSDYDFSLVDVYHQKDIVFMGGGTAAAVFPSEAEAVVFQAMATRDALHQLVDHGNGRHNGSLANPAFRDHIFNYIKLQIDGGVDGVFLDEVNGAGCSGGEKWRWNGNECFDDYFLADFNRYLLAKYPEYSVADWQREYGMSSDNLPSRLFPVDDLQNNFNYRNYLQSKGFAKEPLNPENPMASEWGRVIANRMVPYFGGFLEQAFVTYWRELVTRIRDYARVTQGKEIYITSNGIIPFVDFNSLGMYDYNVDNNGNEVDYVPVVAGHLNGSLSLQSHFRTLRAYSESISNGAPLVLFIDWPTQMMLDYQNLPQSEREDFWKIYVAEAYANGIYYALHLKTSIASFATAEELGMMPFFKAYAHFYRRNASYYHEVTLGDASVQVSAANIATSVMEQGQHSRTLLHLNNHNYNKRMSVVKDFSVELPVAAMPQSVSMVSPDFQGRKQLPFSFNKGVLRISVDELKFYNVIEINWAPQTVQLHCDATLQRWPQNLAITANITNGMNDTVTGWQVCFSFAEPPVLSQYWSFLNPLVQGNSICGQNTVFNSVLPVGAHADIGLNVTLADEASGWVGCSAEAIIPQPNESLTCAYRVVSEWRDGFSAVVDFYNAGESIINGWNIEFTGNQPLTIVESWGADISSVSGSQYRAQSKEWNSYLGVGQAQYFGFTATKPTAHEAIELRFLNGDCVAATL